MPADTSFGTALARLFRLNDWGWDRHANPWSVWTRVATLPLIILAFWSRAWLGWHALIPIFLVLIWTVINPVLFPPPRTTRSWASRAVLGERVWLNRKSIPIPPHHARAANILVAVSLCGTVILIIALVRLDPAWALLGASIAILGKLWFVDRMVWLYQDMRDATPQYQSWDR
jgi:hypothetical protein